VVGSVGGRDRHLSLVADCFCVCVWGGEESSTNNLGSGRCAGGAPRFRGPPGFGVTGFPPCFFSAGHCCHAVMPPLFHPSGFTLLLPGRTRAHIYTHYFPLPPSAAAPPAGCAAGAGAGGAAGARLARVPRVGPAVLLPHWWAPCPASVDPQSMGGRGQILGGFACSQGARGLGWRGDGRRACVLLRPVPPLIHTQTHTHTPPHPHLHTDTGLPLFPCLALAADSPPSLAELAWPNPKASETPARFVVAFAQPAAGPAAGAGPSAAPKQEPGPDGQQQR
jgi:hypothetical protein